MEASAALARDLGRLAGKEHCFFRGRASSALRTTLEALAPRFPERVIALPSFLCHAPVAGVLAAGWQPMFVDVDPATGLVPDAEWARAIDRSARVFLLVHLLGSVAPTARLAARRSRGDAFVIEDACQALGARVGGESVGRFGDATLFSFGYSKIIDAGHGGVLLTDDAELIAAIPAPPPAGRGRAASDIAPAEAAFREEFFRRKRLLAETGDERLLRGLLAAYVPNLEMEYDHRASGAILGQLGLLDKAASSRREKRAAYLDALDGREIVPLGSRPGDVPWRFACTVPGTRRAEQEALSEALRRAGIDVSNWYLPTHWMTFGVPLTTGDMAATRRLSETIFQFWVDERTSLEAIGRNCEIIRRILRRR